MDMIHKFQFQFIRIIIIIICIPRTLAVNHFTDPGDVMAKFFMRPLYDGALVSIELLSFTLIMRTEQSAENSKNNIA